MAEIEALQKKANSEVVSDPAKGESDLLALAAKSEVISQGAQIFAAKCVACHGPQGQGLVGPNLTDDFWIHGGKIDEIKNVVVNGVIEKGMLSWKAMMTNDEINAVVAFIWSIRGTQPSAPKAAEGVEVKR